MKYLAPLVALLGLSVASAIPNNYDDDCDCPVNGTLPEDPSTYVSTSAFYEISARKPNKHYQPSLTAKVTPGNLCFITNLALPSSAYGKTCTLKFLFPTQKQAKQNYKFEGPGHFTFTGYATGVGADDSTTYNNQPAPGPSPPSPPEILPGNAYTIFSGPCGVEEGAEQTLVSGSLCSADTKLEFTQSTGPGCPLGFFVELS
ncbi:Ubiquitin 3 binding protein But2 [Neofusicoccum parvum]|uniref:Ubiquitin 3 binding protein But2 C-terminal domain-containing protein n=3 Tax=Neofusicoccum TaxID=407951 RepID=A0ABR3SXY6_9PEZI|nr:putative gpi anchored cell wall protein [Neofusicoccum parvum UCRNP2]GME24584.1 Ubiquitin 3 binding protein But2 [Neofusicoccum parvum]GME51596.1 Ubiquitin 3 binding protein But2 [Neofusicoccum parvum]